MSAIPGTPEAQRELEAAREAIVAALLLPENADIRAAMVSLSDNKQDNFKLALFFEQDLSDVPLAWREEVKKHNTRCVLNVEQSERFMEIINSLDPDERWSGRTYYAVLSSVRKKLWEVGGSEYGQAS